MTEVEIIAPCVECGKESERFAIDNKTGKDICENCCSSENICGACGDGTPCDCHLEND